MIRRIRNELRQKRMRSAKKWHRARLKKRRLERKLGKIDEQLEADVTLNCHGVLVAIHHLRSPNGRAENRFQFYRKGRRGVATDFAQGDLEALFHAIEAAQEYRTKDTHEVGLKITEEGGSARSLVKLWPLAHLGKRNGEKRVEPRLIDKNKNPMEGK